MAGNWWDPTQGWGQTANGEVDLNAADYLLNAATGGLYGAAKGTAQTGDVGRGLMGAYASPLLWATGNMGRDDARAVQSAEQDIVDAANQGQGKVRAQLAQDAKRNAPYQQAGRDALAQQRALAGLDGPEAQQAAIAMLEQSPQFEEMIRQSEQAILANASATGGLRGGNVQQGLAQNRPAILTDLINQQYNRFGGLAAAGQQSGQFQSGLGLQGAGMQADLYGQRGAAQAGSTLGQQAAVANGRQQAIGLVSQAAGGIASFGSSGVLGGLASAAAPPRQTVL